MNIKNKIFYSVAWFTLLSALGLILYISFLLFYPIKPFEVFGPYKVKTKVVIAGQPLIYTANYCRRMDGPGTVSRTLNDGLVYVLSESPVLNANQGCKAQDIKIIVPKDVPSETYTMHIKATFKVNALRNYVVEVDTEPFDVINATEAADLK